MSGRANAVKLKRCPCCGLWLSAYVWDFRKVIFCQECEKRGYVAGHKNSCQYCLSIYPENSHWTDKPPVFSLTMDREEVDELIAAHKAGCRFCDVLDQTKPLVKRFDPTLRNSRNKHGKVWVCEAHKTHTLTWEELQAARRGHKVAPPLKRRSEANQPGLFDQ
jgi:hypothetical protein